MNSTQAQPSAESQQGTILVILGAGCSFKCRYPLASDMLAQLKEFGDNLGESAARLRNLVLEMIREFKTVQPAEDAYTFGYPAIGDLSQRLNPDRPLVQKGIVSDKDPVTRQLILSLRADRRVGSNAVVLTP